MYLIELIVKWINPKKNYERKEKFDPFAEDVADETECEHTFLPVDSTGETLACSKCGLLVNRTELKDENIFKSS